MKRIALILLAFLPFAACQQVNDLLRISFSFEQQETFTIPVIPAPGSASLASPAVYLNLDSMIRAQNSQLSGDNIKEVRIKSCELSLLDGNKDNNFSALQALKISMTTDKNTVPVSLGEITDNPDTESYVLTLPVSQVPDLKDYFLGARQFAYQVSGTARKATAQPMQCQVKVVYTIVAGL